MDYHIFKIEADGKTAISKTPISKDGVRCIKLASFLTEQLRDYTFLQMKSHFAANPDTYQDRHFIE